MSSDNTPHADAAFGFTSSLEEGDASMLEVMGEIPDWLDGALIRTGPALFENSNERFMHWFDGLAKLYRFSFANGSVEFTSRFLGSDAYNSFSTSGKIEMREFGTNPKESAFRRVAAIFNANYTDNANVNVARFANDCYVALTETPTPVQFDAPSLRTIGHFRYDDTIQCQVTTAHPHLDADGAIYNVFTKIGPRSAYQFCRMAKGSRVRELLAEVPIQNPAYIHSFALTDNHIILVEGSFTVRPLSLLLSGKPFIENFDWQASKPSRFIVVSKSNSAGSRVRIVETEPLFVFHHVNAFEASNQISVDLLAYDSAAIVKALYLENLRNPNRVVPAPVLKRCILDSAVKSVRSETLGASFELPRINYSSYSRKQYRFVYGVISDSERNLFTGITKVDLVSGVAKEWKEDNYYATEPVFVANKEGGAEDSGVILSIVINCASLESLLLVLDSSTMAELARARIPHFIPFHFHGQFFGV